jgi:hypothetical protein
MRQSRWLELIKVQTPRRAQAERRPRRNAEENGVLNLKMRGIITKIRNDTMTLCVLLLHPADCQSTMTVRWSRQSDRVTMCVLHVTFVMPWIGSLDCQCHCIKRHRRLKQASLHRLQQYYVTLISKKEEKKKKENHAILHGFKRRLDTFRWRLRMITIDNASTTNTWLLSIRILSDGRKLEKQNDCSEI